MLARKTRILIITIISLIIAVQIVKKAISALKYVLSLIISFVA